MGILTPVYRQLIDHPAAWTSASLGSDPKACLTYPMTPQQLEAIDLLLASTAHLTPRQVTRRDFEHPAINALLLELREIMQNGRGAVLVRGLTPERYTPEQFERVFWGFGTHLGKAMMQNAYGDRLCHVTSDKDYPNARGYRGTGELSPHTDAFAVVGLMCIQRAEAGGYSHLVSALAIHNEILKTRPELLEAMYRGTLYASLEARGTDIGVTPCDVPIFSCVEGQVSCFFSRQNSNEAVERTGIALRPDFAEAADCFEALANDPRFRVEFLLEPGEMMIWNNYVLLHARTKFDDSPQHKRDLLRLWLDVENGRPVVPELFASANIYAELFRHQMAQAGDRLG